MLEVELLCELVLDVETQPQRVGNGPAGKRQIFAITGGRFDGPRLRGTVLPGGGDWLVIRADGVGELDVRVTLCTDEDAIIYLHYTGILHYPDAAKARLRAGERVDPSEYYLRSTPRFETGAPGLAWLNRTVCVGVGRQLEPGIGYEIYAVL